MKTVNEEKKNKATPGVLRALAKGRSRSICLGCGFAMPIYTGRYPKKCPLCGDEHMKAKE